MKKIEVDISDLEKIMDALIAAKSFHELRDEMNGQLHLASSVRYSPLTSNLQAEADRLAAIILEGEKVEKSIDPDVGF